MPEKTCSKCKTPQPAENFNKQTRAADGLGSWCKGCKKGYDRTPAMKQKQRESHLRINYGLTQEAFNDMVAKQHGVCAICFQRPEPLTRAGHYGTVKHLLVDHNHTTGKVRGLLCNDCNISLGRLNTSAKLLSAACYLELHGE